MSNDTQVRQEAPERIWLEREPKPGFYQRCTSTQPANPARFIEYVRVSAPIVAPVVDRLFEAKLLGFPNDGDRIRLCEPCLRRATDDNFVIFASALPLSAPAATVAPDACASVNDAIGLNLFSQLVGTVFDNTAASPETLKQTVIERIADSVTPLSTLAKTAAEEIDKLLVPLREYAKTPGISEIAAIIERCLAGGGEK